MRIEMTKRKGGFYTHSFEILGTDEYGRATTFIIPHSCKTYAQAIKYWAKIWGKKCKAELLRNSKPFDNRIAHAC